MFQKNNYYLPYLEWEILDRPISITDIDDQGNLPNKSRIEVCRDDEYNIEAILYSKNLDLSYIKKDGEAGSRVKTFTITGSNSEDNLRYTLESCYIENEHFETKEETQVTINIGLHGLRVKNSDKKPARLCEWYINGPNYPVFLKCTERKLLSTHIRNRLEGIDGTLDSIKRNRENPHFSRDFIFIKTDSLQFIIEKAPEGFGPKWSSNLGIEYKETWAPIPETSTRERISEICSFIFGRQLLNIGYTKYDEKENIIEAYARNPWLKQAKSFCNKADKPPIAITSIPPNHRVEELLAKIIPEYIKYHEKLRLKEALWSIWVSNQMPTGLNIPVLASALEAIINGWFRNNPRKQSYLEKKEFERLLNPEISTIKNKLKNKLEKDQVEKIINKILYSNSFGTEEKRREFFKDIKLTLTTQEKTAFKERNKFTHGDIILEKENWELIIQRKITIETLIDKVFLRVLSYSGDFFDRSVVPWIEKQDLKKFMID